MDSILKIADAITSMRINILRILREEKHPQELASSLGMSRQGVDKHLSILYEYGFIDKRVKMGKRPMVYYSLTSEGADFLSGFEDLVHSHILSIRDRYRESLAAFDRMLVDGEISEKEYWHLRKDIENRFRWVIAHDKKGEKGGPD